MTFANSRIKMSIHSMKIILNSF